MARTRQDRRNDFDEFFRTAVTTFTEFRDNKELKQELTQAARSAIQWDPELREYALRKMNNKCYNVVLNNVKFKLILRMFAVVKKQSKYVDNYQKVA